MGGRTQRERNKPVAVLRAVTMSITGILYEVLDGQSFLLKLRYMLDLDRCHSFACTPQQTGYLHILIVLLWTETLPSKQGYCRYNDEVTCVQNTASVMTSLLVFFLFCFPSNESFRATFKQAVLLLTSSPTCSPPFVVY